MAAFAGGLAGLVAWVVARPLATNETFAWAASLPVFGLKLSITLLGGAVGSLVLMPSRTALLRDIRGEDDPPPGYPLMLLVAALGGIAVLRVPDVLAWWRVEWSFLQPILGEGRTIPRSSRKWFSFSWADGVLRRQPEGFELARLTPPSAPGRFLTRTYDVIDARTNEMLARFEPRGADWEIVDAFGNQLGRVLKSSVGGPVKYRAAVGDRDVVSFKWALAGLSTSSAELEVEFLASPGPDAMTQPSLDRVLALAIAPILEQRARIANERANSA